jgi:hypothetical protein
MDGKAIIISIRSVGKTAKTRERSIGERTAPPHKPVAKIPEVHQGSAADVLSAFAELYRQI